MLRRCCGVPLSRRTGDPSSRPRDRARAREQHDHQGGGRRPPHRERPPENWRGIGIDLQYDGHLIVRLRPVGDDGTDVEVFSFGNLLASEHLRRYRSADRLAELIEDVHRRAIERV